MKLNFGLDIGIASVGWAVVADNYEVLESGANLFSSADANKNMERRAFRQGRRLHRRRNTRIRDFEKFWKENGLVIPDLPCNNQLELRVKGLTEKITEEQIYFVLKNMLLHRGISYLEDALEESSSGKSEYARGILQNQKELEAQKLPCQIQYERLHTHGKYRGEVVVTEESGENMTFSNIFTVAAYQKEITAFFNQQKNFHGFITEEFTKKYLEIFSRKREYYVGPGNELSRTDYGKYTTKIDPETGTYITEDNIFEKLIGKCSVYPEEMRASGASYTAQEFNVLNDLNNLRINNEKLTKEEKWKIVSEIKSAKRVDMRKIIKKVIGEDITTMAGARLDKNDKEEFHSFSQYNLFRKEFEKNNLSIERLSREELDKIGDILTLNTEKESILAAFQREKLNLTEEEKECLVSIRKKNGTQFSKWQSFSIKIMKELIPQMYDEPKNQMEILTEMGVFKSKAETFTEYSKIPRDIITQEIYNPVVRRSIGISVDIVNALIKKYGYPDQIVIEMPRDKNDEEQKKRIKDTQKRNEKELKDIIDKVKKEYGISITDESFRGYQQLALRLKLWNEQDGCCLYSGKTIQIDDLLNNPDLFEVDHIIPRSISFDDSRSNKVLVYRTENQKKGNKTPYMYLSNVKRDWDFHEYMSRVLELKEKKYITKAKSDKLLYLEDITKVEVLKKFIARNINDTRYASRVILNSLQAFFQSKNAETKIKVVRGSFTSQMRKAMKLDKNREETYSHHAVDAMLICYSQMGYEAYHRLQSEFINFEQEEIVDRAFWEKKMDDMTYEEVMYQNKWMNIKSNIQAAEKKVKYWHKVDKKPNRGLCNQTIRGTRNYDDKIQKINKLDIYTLDGYATLKKMIEGGKSQRFLMYRNDRRTWDNMLSIMEEYADAVNPFSEYEKETGDFLRKYAKKHNGARIIKLKYLDGEVNSCIDISHKYGYERNSKRVILESLKPYRTDVYSHKESGNYFLVGIKYSDLKYQDGRYVIDEEAYQRILIDEKMIDHSRCWTDLDALGYEFQFSLYRDDIIEYEKNGDIYLERFLSRTKPQQRNYIETKPVDAPKFEKRHQVGLSKTKVIRKISTDILGNRYKCGKEKIILSIDKI